VLRSTLTMTSVLASLSAMLAIGSAPSAAATEGVPSSLVSGYATGTHATHVHHNRRARITATATKPESAAVVDPPAPEPLEQERGNHPAACIRVETFHVDTQGRLSSSMGC
jgi:hypothetical protein